MKISENYRNSQIKKLLRSKRRKRKNKRIRKERRKKRRKLNNFKRKHSGECFSSLPWIHSFKIRPSCRQLRNNSWIGRWRQDRIINKWGSSETIRWQSIPYLRLLIKTVKIQILKILLSHPTNFKINKSLSSISREA